MNKNVIRKMREVGPDLDRPRLIRLSGEYRQNWRYWVAPGFRGYFTSGFLLVKFGERRSARF